MDVIKSFYFNSTTSKVNQRIQMLKEIYLYLNETPDVSDGLVRACLFALSQTLGLYRDTLSRRQCLALVQLLLRSYHNVTVPYLTQILDVMSNFQLANKAPNRSESARALVGLLWSCEVVRAYYMRASRNKNELDKLVAIQAGLYYGALASQKKSITCSAVRQMRSLWKEIPDAFTVYTDALLSSEASAANCVLLASLTSFQKASFNERKTEILNAYVKAIIMCKAPVAMHALICCIPIVVEINHADFETLIIPALQKSLLRSPENILPVFCSIVGDVGIDLSRHALSLVKMLGPQLISKTDANREIAANVVVAMATQCSDAESVGEAVKYLFALLKGSEGKLTLPGQKKCVLSAIGGLGVSPIGSRQSATSLVASVVVMFLPFLQQEIHDGTLVSACAALSKWCAQLWNEIPSELLSWFLKAPTLKTFTPIVRMTLLDCMIATFKSDTLQKAEPVIPYLLKCIEKGSQQQSQIPLVSEALYASILLSKMEKVELKKDHKLTGFWSIVLDPKKSLFTSDKFLQNASDDVLVKLTIFTSHLFLDHSLKMQDDIAKPYYKALTFLLLNKPWSVQQAAQRTIKKSLASYNGVQHCSSLLAEFHPLLERHPKVQPPVDDDEKIEMRRQSQKYCKALQCIMSVPAFKNDKSMAENTALKVLVTSHHHFIRCTNDRFWVSFLLHLKIDPNDFVKKNLSEIMGMLVYHDQHTEAHFAALTSVVEIAPGVVLPLVVQLINMRLTDDKLRQVSMREFNIMKTPEGQLWNLDVLKNIPKTVQNKNMKRESKAYSYKDQLMEQELRKELEMKKKLKDSGGVKGPGGAKEASSRIPQNLSKKEQELVEQELKSESAIRAKAEKINSEFEIACKLLLSVLQSRCIFPDVLAQNVVPLIDPILSLLHSPLACSRSQDLFIEMNKVLVSDELAGLGLKVSYATLRLYKPVFDVDERWCFHDLNKVVPQLMMELSKTLQSNAQSDAFLCYIFPFLRKLLNSQDTEVSLVSSALRILLSHAQKDSKSNALPWSSIMECMFKLITSDLVDVDNMACNVLLATCEAAQYHDSVEATAEVKMLMKALLSPRAVLRRSALKGLRKMQRVVRSLDKTTANDVHVVRRMWVAMHDEDEENRKLAEELWNSLLFHTTASLCQDIMEDIQYNEIVIQQAASRALNMALDLHDELTPLVLQILIDAYNEKKERPPPVLDELGRIVLEAPPDDYQSRIGIACAMKEISSNLSEEEVKILFTFFVPDALTDRHEEVRKKMLEAALESVNQHGKEVTSTLLEIIENFLREAPTSKQYDDVRQAAVILLGTLAKHLSKDDPKVKPIVAKLTETLSTPSQAVQEAVANCLPALVPSIKADAPEIVRKLLVILLESDVYGERKGAAYGLAGMVKGLGIISFKQLDIMTKLTDAIQDKKKYRRKEGALFAFEMFCKMLGRLFEPYVVHVLPHLLLCFGDSNQFVREAAENTARAVMNNLSSHGVRLVLPSLLNALESDDSWRTKTGSAELLGAMAFCAPKQLSACLPSIVPKLCEVLTDSHPKVQKAGEQALKHIGSVIRNPEIQAISGVLLQALSDPARKTSKCLETLLNTKFVHFIDAPSLALILPVVERSFSDRSTDTRKMAAQIIGNMYSLTDEKDLKPYLSAIIPGVKGTLLDPVPEVRGIAAKALGAMVRGSGESQFEELLPWLMENLTSEQSSVDRSGAAQGLSEVLASLGPEKLAKLMPEVVKTASSNNIAPYVRDGYIMLFVYLPLTFGEDFVCYIGDVLPPILKALADETEYVRATALCAGQRIISTFSETAVPVLLPQLEKGLFDDNWRIRLSSIQLLGDLLYNISGVTGKMSAHGEDDDNFGTAEGFQALVERLGQDRRDLVLSGLYMGRSDVALNVRQSALHVWKIIVPNTPRVLREILPTLFKLLLGCLASPTYDKRQIAARTLGDIVKKLGERMLPELIPILEKGLDSEDASQRQGVCIGLTEIIKSCSKEAIIVFTNSLVPTVRKALCDPLPDVRRVAATTFEHLHSTIGIQALDQILPAMLEDLQDEEKSASAVDGLRQIIAVKGKVVLPFIVPKLTEPPVNTEVLAFFSSVAGEALTRHLPTILKALLTTLIAADGSEEYSSILEDAEKVIMSVEGEHGMRIIIDDLLLGAKNQNPQMRYACIMLLRAFCKDSDSDFSDYVSSFVQTFIRLLADPEERVQSQAWDALSAVTGTLDAADLQKHISSVRYALRYVKNDDVVVKTGLLPGFCLPKKGMTPLLPIFREGILNGSPDLKEQAARGIGECIQFLTSTALKPSVITITGPLIRILGDRFNWSVKLAVLETLSLLLQKVGLFLKPFLPQLQTTFSKSLQDPNRSVRIQAATALGNLCSIHARVDPLFTELNNNINSSEDISFKETYLQALRGCIQNGAQKLNEKLKKDLIATLCEELSCKEDKSRCCAAGCLGALCTFLNDEQISQLLDDQVFVKDATASWPTRQGRSTLLAAALKESCRQVLTDQDKSRILTQISAYAATDRVQIVMDGIHSAAYLLYHYSLSDDEVPSQIIDAFKSGFEHTSNDIRIEAARSLNWCMQQLSKPSDDAQTNGEAKRLLPSAALYQLISSLIVLSQEKNTGVKSAAIYAMVALLRLREGEENMQNCVKALSTREGNVLQELYKQRLKKVAAASEITEDIDNTIIKS